MGLSEKCPCHFDVIRTVQEFMSWESAMDCELKIQG